MIGTPTRRVARTAERVLFLGCMMFTAGAQAAEPPKLLSRSALLIEEKTGDAYVRLSPAEPAKFLLTGPGRMQAELRANLGEGAAPPMVVSVFLGGKVAGSFRVQPVASTDSSAWKGETVIRPSQTVGFHIDVEPGPQACEIKINGGPAGGAALLLGPAATAKRPLATTAPVVASRVASPMSSTPSPMAQPARPAAAPIPVTPDASQTGPAEEAPANHAAFVGVAWISQSEWNAFHDRRAAEVLIGYKHSLREKPLLFAVIGEVRSGQQRVRLVNDAPGETPRDAHENRYALGLSGTWGHQVFQRGMTALEANAGLGYRVEAHDNSVAPFMVGFAGPVLAVSARRGLTRFAVGLEPGYPLHDSSPGSLAAGPIKGRLGWSAEFHQILGRDTDLMLGYRGEVTDRTHSRHSSEGFVTGVSVRF